MREREREREREGEEGGDRESEREFRPLQLLNEGSKYERLKQSFGYVADEHI